MDKIVHRSEITDKKETCKKKDTQKKIQKDGRTENLQFSK